MARRHIALAALALCLVPLSTQAGSKLAGVATVDLTPATFHAQLELYREGDGSFREGTLFRLAPGEYRLRPTPYEEERCGNCDDPATPVQATVGLRVSGTGIVFEAMPDAEGEVVIRTGAGYGLLFEDCTDCMLRGVTITGGERDPDPNATCAAVVAKDSELSIEECVITENLGDSTLLATNIVGVIGIAGREGARLTIRGNRILRNSWDGIALYRGAEALIEGNLIDGVDRAGARTRGGGRGVGIGLTWDAAATLRHNRVARYWKGIGVFVDAQATITENVVEDVLTWGIALWDAGRGRPSAEIRRNVIFGTGACGISLMRKLGGDPAPGLCVENIVARSGQDARYDGADRYCAQCPVAVHAMPEGFELATNWLWENRRAAAGEHDRAGEDLADAEFMAATAELLDALVLHRALAGSQALKELPRRR